MRAEIIASGTELLLGELDDTNTSFIASQLALLGIDLYYVSIVGDNYERFLGVLKQARLRSDIIIITGGLGPTKGDITREVIAGLMGEKLEIDPITRQHIIDFFNRLGLEMPENNLKQATLIPSAKSMPNPQGTAPGWWVETEGKIIISLPGPPSEMQSIWHKEVYPKLKNRGEAVIISRTLKTFGLSEARIDQMVGPFMSSANPTLALYAKSDGIQLRITAKADSKEQAQSIIREREVELRQILKDSLWGADNDTLETIIGELLLKKSLSLAVAESFTGGLLSYTLSGMPESSRFFKGGIVALDAKTRQRLKIGMESGDLKADMHSAVHMSARVREQFLADIGIGIDGNLDFSGEIPFGEAFISINMKQPEYNFSQRYPWRPHQIVRRSVVQSLFVLRKILIEL
jgi:nicotinamide-nucleotide amidase